MSIISTSNASVLSAKPSDKTTHNLNTRISDIRAKWKTSTRKHRERKAREMQAQLAALLMTDVS